MAGCLATGGAETDGEGGDFGASRLGGGVASLSGDLGLISRPNSSFPVFSSDVGPESAVSCPREPIDAKLGLRGGLYGLTWRLPPCLFGGLLDRLRCPLYDGLLSSRSLSR